MASYGPIQRAPNFTAKTSGAREDEAADSTQKNRDYNLSIKFVWPFNVPSTPEAAATRVIRNMGSLGLYYTIFLWIGLYISLIPARKVALIWLVSTSVIVCVYLMLLHDFPNSVLLHKTIDKHFVLQMFAILTVVELVLTRAGLHLLVTLAVGLPIILVHALLWVEGSSLFQTEVVPNVSNELGDEFSSDLV
ncbi:Prenylated rab acceptor PRA1 [Dillenia turbinata]|uniref:PRA1 family protein n=1 Tax=Dillenia turbinata TaxID=194707 RepID=A0AAN8YZ06_9MAGN